MTKDEIKAYLKKEFEQVKSLTPRDKVAYTIGFITGIREINNNGSSNCFNDTTDSDLLDLLIESIRDNLLDGGVE